MRRVNPASLVVVVVLVAVGLGAWYFSWLAGRDNDPAQTSTIEQTLG